MTETWDAYDQYGKRLPNRRLVRGEPIPDGVFHLVVDILVKHTDGSYLVMRRDMQKETRGGEWEATAGGSALFGEEAATAAMRELFEETGISAESLLELGSVTCHATHAIYREFLCVTDAVKDSIRLQAGETVAYRWIGGEELSTLWRTGGQVSRMSLFVRP